MKKGVTVLMAFAILSIVLAAESRPERPARPKLEDMTKEELLSQISGQLKDGEAFEFIPILGKEKDATGVEYYTVKTAEKGERKVDDLDKSELMQLLGRIIVVTETKEGPWGAMLSMAAMIDSRSPPLGGGTISMEMQRPAARESRTLALAGDLRALASSGNVVIRFRRC